MSKPIAVIFDLDGCLLDYRGRIQFSKSFQDANQSLNQALLKYDPPKQEMVEIWHSILLKGFHPIIITARATSLKDQTIKWLERNSLRPHLIFFKEDGDARSNVTYKLETLKTLMNTFGIHLAIDDELEICDAYRSVNVPVLHIKN